MILHVRHAAARQEEFMRRDRVDTQPQAVVLSCLGGAQGELGVVRTLGREGVEVVLMGESPETIARYSRYVSAFHHVPHLFQDSDEWLAFLVEYASRQDQPPVLIPTADPDLNFVSTHRALLQRHYRLVVPPAAFVDAFLHKDRFAQFADRHDFPVPRTIVPRDREDLEARLEKLRFPVIVKPILPQTWGRAEIAAIVDGKKAERVDQPTDLLQLYQRLAAYDPGVVVQEYIHGRDDRLYSLHIYMNEESDPVAAFTGRKIRTHPAYAGIGCYVESVYEPQLVELGGEILRRIGYTGLALAQFKQDERDGRFWLIEINPRVSSWNYLAAECGVNLPYLAYRAAAGLETGPTGLQREGARYLYLDHDIRAAREYRRQGELSWTEWLVSVWRADVYQHFSADDLRPFMKAARGTAWSVLRKLAKYLPRPRRSDKTAVEDAHG